MGKYGRRDFLIAVRRHQACDWEIAPTCIYRNITAAERSTAAGCVLRSRDSWEL